jgi:KDEL-tailed cysteine endopeptidase
MKAIFAASCLASLKEVVGAPDYLALWSQFKVDFGKSYDSNGDDEERRFNTFKDNVDFIESTNAKKLSYQLGVNQFADLTREEYAATYLGGYKPERLLGVEGGIREPFPNITGLEVPDSVDWVAAGAVTDVKNQESCGSCWAFSTTGAIEGAYYVESKKLVSLSEEDLVQCDTTDNGCHGGIMESAFEFVEKHGGICSGKSYPYSSGTGVTGKCHPGCQPVVTLTGYVDVPTKNEVALQAAVAKQPVSIAIEADKGAFQLYKGGVLSDPSCGTKLDHGVLIVGYGTDAGKDYWKVKNSWGPTWGEQGYIRLARGTTGAGECGLAMQPTYPTGAKAAAPSPPGPTPPAPSPPSPAPGTTHYGNPSSGCESDEQAVEVQGVTGEICSPSCLAAACPTDVPAGTTVKPQCALQNPTGTMKLCTLICDPMGDDSQCGPATCEKDAQQPNIGICTYPSEKDAQVPKFLLGPSRAAEIVV